MGRNKDILVIVKEECQQDIQGIILHYLINDMTEIAILYGLLK